AVAATARVPAAVLCWSLACTSLAAVSCGGGSATSAPASAPSPLLNQPLKPIGGRTTAGARIDLKALEGRIIVVKFFAKYCKPCEKTLPGAQRLHQESADVAVIGISEDESQADLDYLVQKHGLSFPIVRDPGNVIAGRFRVTALPATFITDKTGKVVWVGGEQQTEADLESVIGSVRAEAAPGVAGPKAAAPPD
ncbi:MAG: TlpA family protein disulfide reductase, partial [Myxococcales bacterium]|nr:TlpA family protein disulfide reductase [Myxococcales bacterium]